MADAGETTAPSPYCRAREPRREQASTTLPPAVGHRRRGAGLLPALRRSLGAYFNAISRRPKPSGGDSTASDLATNASGGVTAEAAAGPRGAVGASAEVRE